MVEISVIIPVYNAEEYLEKCIESILSQTFCDFELILVDDGSTDGSGIICDRFAEQDKRIKVVHKKNNGAAKAIIDGIEMSEGKFLQLVDDDDWLEPTMLEKLLCEIKKGYDIVFSNFKIVRPGNVVEPYKTFQVGESQIETVRNMLIDGYGGNMWYKLSRRELLDVQEKSFITLDLCTSVHIFLEAEKVSKVDEYLYNYNLFNTHSTTVTESLFHRATDFRYKEQIIRDIKEHNLWEELKEPVYWRILLKKTGFVFFSSLYKKYNDYFPEASEYLDSCPQISPKMKSLMKMLRKGGLINRTIVFLLSQIYILKSKFK